MRDQGHKATSGVNPGEPTLIRDPDGRVFFYAGGPSYGYVVPDVWRERALSDAIERFKKMGAAFSYVLIVPLAGSIWLLGGPHTDFGLALLTFTLAVVVIGRRLQKQWCFAELIAGLEAAEPRDIWERRRGFIIMTLLVAAYCSFVIWRIVHEIAPFPY